MKKSNRLADNTKKKLNMLNLFGILTCLSGVMMMITVLLIALGSISNEMVMLCLIIFFFSLLGFLLSWASLHWND